MSVNDEINIKEHNIMSNMLKNAIVLFEESIKDIMGKTEKVKYEDILKGILHIQISTELFFKYYIACVYGFANILTPKMQRIKDNTPSLYLMSLNKDEIKTLSYDNIFKFFMSNNDDFFYVKERGAVNFCGLEIGYFGDIFDRFNNIRNAIVHLAYNFDDKEIEWIKSEFTVFIIFVVYKILKYSSPRLWGKQEYEKFCDYEKCKELDETPIEVFKKFLSRDVINILKNDENYIAEIEELASDLGEAYQCDICGKYAKVLDIEDGWSKCFYCGELYYAGYVDCPVCKQKHVVQYDDLNIDVNHNVLPGYCSNCKKTVAVYKCPECGCAYGYDYEYVHKIDFYWDCCKKNFNTSYYGGSANCPLCNAKDKVHFYGKFSNFEAHCEECKEKMFVYVCPECGSKYPYDIDIESRINKVCCKKNFKPY